jgi:5'-nucleotidase (lipoprotein e(P4) family)
MENSKSLWWVSLTIESRHGLNRFAGFQRSNRTLRILGLSLFLLTSWTALFAQGSNQSNQSDNTYIESAVLWQQASGERRALSYQAFNLARMMLDQDLRANRKLRKPRAVIVDIDETVLDNSRYEAKVVKDGISYPTGWTDWINRAEADAVPGAVEFLKYATSRRVRVFYVTNRKEIEKSGTEQNLKRLGFPAVNDETLLVRTDKNSDSKEPRRTTIGAKYRVVLLMGDDLNDFAKIFEDSKSSETRIAAADSFKQEFGKRFIVLPNAMYGNWELSIYGYQRLSDKEKAELRRKVLKSY